MFNKLMLCLSFFIIVFLHYIFFYNHNVQNPIAAVDHKSSSHPISLRKVTLKQKALKKKERKLKKHKKKKKHNKIVKKAKKKILKQIEKQKIEEPIKIVKKEQKELRQSVTKPTPKNPNQIVSSTLKNQIKNEYLLKLREKIETYKTYPKRAKRLKQQGQVVVSFKILDNGEIIKTQISEASKYKRLNKAAIELIEKIVRFDPIPKELDKKSWNIEIPINYFIG